MPSTKSAPVLDDMRGIGAAMLILHMTKRNAKE